MSDLYTTSPLTWRPVAPDPDMFASSEIWTILLKDGAYILDYISGEHAGDARRLTIPKVEAEQLRDGALAFDELLVRHGAH